MDVEKAWNTIIENLRGKAIELHTVPKTKKIPLWFTASTDGNIVFIDKAVDNKPSSNLSMKRRLTYKTFEKVYPLYLRRAKGEHVSSEVAHITVDQVYFFSLIEHLC